MSGHSYIGVALLGVRVLAVLALALETDDWLVPPPPLPTGVTVLEAVEAAAAGAMALEGDG